MYSIWGGKRVRDEAGKPAAADAADTDISVHQQMEEALQQANAKLKLLSAITRHDINNQLMALTGYIELMQAKYPSLSEDLRRVGSAADRIAAMIRFTREYEDIGVGVPFWHDSRALVEAAARQATLGTVRVVNDIPSGTEIFADPLITRVLYNLMDNAVRYGGKITIIRFAVAASGSGMVVMCEDDGDGIPSADKGRIFDRGFGKNTGMGLFLAREILSLTGIAIRETGVQGKGARFEMVVPDKACRLNRRRIMSAGTVPAGHFLIPVVGK